MKTLLLSFLLIISACNSGGGSNGGSTPVKPIPNPPVEEIPSLTMSCSDTRATSIDQGLPFHKKQTIIGVDYYLICNAGDLVELANNTNHYNKNFIVGADIELFEYYNLDNDAYLSGPITNQFMIGKFPNNPFTGLFIGNGYSISDYRFINNNTSQETYCGLFGYTKNSQISQLYLDNIRIDSYYEAGICAPLIGFAENTLINDNLVLFDALDNVPQEYWNFIRGYKIAGLVGKLSFSAINDSYSVIRMETIKNTDRPLAGGLYVMSENNSSIRNSFIDSFMPNTFHIDTLKGAIGVYSPTVENDSPVLSSELFANLYYSSQTGFTSACSTDIHCEQSSNIISIDKTVSGEDYFKIRTNEPLSSWNSAMWMFFDSSANKLYPQQQ